MTLITITLTEEEQDLILGIAGEEGFSFDPSAIQPIAEKIRRTRKAEEAFREAYEQPDTTECGLCGVPKDIHPDLTADHHWQWLRRVRPADEELNDARGLTGSPGDFPGEPAG